MMAIENGVFVGIGKDNMTIFMPNAAIDQMISSRIQLQKEMKRQGHGDASE